MQSLNLELKKEQIKEKLKSLQQEEIKLAKKLEDYFFYYPNSTDRAIEAELIIAVPHILICLGFVVGPVVFIIFILPPTYLLGAL